MRVVAKRMTVIRWLSRRWPLVVAGALALLALVTALKNPERVYWAKTEVVFLYPGLAPVSSTFDGGTEALVNFTELVRLKIEDHDERGATVGSLSGGTLYGAGFRRGVSVVLPNLGGQWTRNYSQPRLSVEVVDTDPARVRASMASVINVISSTARDLQIQVSTPEQQMITVNTIPNAIQVVPEGPTSSLVARGFIAGFGVVLLLIPLVSVTRRRRQEPIPREVDR